MMQNPDKEKEWVKHLNPETPVQVEPLIGAFPVGPSYSGKEGNVVTATSTPPEVT